MVCYTPTMLQSEVGQRLREVRDSRGWSQDSVASEMTARLKEEHERRVREGELKPDKEPPTLGGAGLSAVEKGLAGMNLNRLELLAGCLRARIRVFVLKDEDQEEPVLLERQDTEILRHFHAASAFDQDLARRLLAAADVMTEDDRAILTTLVSVLERRKHRPTGKK